GVAGGGPVDANGPEDGVQDAFVSALFVSRCGAPEPTSRIGTPPRGGPPAQSASPATCPGACTNLRAWSSSSAFILRVSAARSCVASLRVAGSAAPLDA